MGSPRQTNSVYRFPPKDATTFRLTTPPTAGEAANDVIPLFPIDEDALARERADLALQVIGLPPARLARLRAWMASARTSG